MAIGKSKKIEKATLSVAEAAQMLGISRAGAYIAIRSGDIPSIKIRSSVKVPRRALEAMLDSALPKQKQTA